MAATAIKLAPEKEMPDTGRRAQNENSGNNSYQTGDRKAKETVPGAPVIWLEDIKGRRAQLEEWFGMAKRRLTGRALKAACMVADQFMVKTLSMHRDDDWLANEYCCGERTIQRCFADLRDAGFGTFEAIKVKIGSVYRTTGRRPLLSIPMHLVSIDALTKTVNAPTNSVHAPTHGGASRPQKETSESKPTENKQQAGKPAAVADSNASLSSKILSTIRESPITTTAIDALIESSKEGMTSQHAFNILRQRLAKRFEIDKGSGRWKLFCAAVEAARAEAIEKATAYRQRIEAEENAEPPTVAAIFAEIEEALKTKPDHDLSRLRPYSAPATMEELEGRARRSIWIIYDRRCDDWNRVNPRAQRSPPRYDRHLHSDTISRLIDVYVDRNKGDLPRVARWREANPNWRQMSPDDTTSAEIAA